MEFAAPGYLWLMFLVVPVFVLGLSAERFALRVREAFSAPTTAPYRRRVAGRLSALTLALASLATALAGPGVWALREGDPRRDLVLVIGVDVSKSMLAEDIDGKNSPPDPATPASRLDAAGRLAMELFGKLDGEKAGLFFFARTGIEVVPPTRDQGFLRYMVQNTGLAELTESGSDLAVAMQTGADMVAGSDRTGGAILLISDGEDTENSLTELMRRSQMMRDRSLPVFTIGTGRPAEVFLPIRRPGLSGIQDFYTDSRGDYLKTRLEEQTLRNIAATTGGAYWRFDEMPTQQLARTLLDKLADARKKISASLPQERRRLDLSPIFLCLGLLFYLGFRVF